MITIDIENQDVEVVVSEEVTGVSIEMGDIYITMTHKQALDIFKRLKPMFD
ncbi:MAG TPA: hypothetical protein VIH30_06710 [Aquirhabdus sp.]